MSAREWQSKNGPVLIRDMSDSYLRAAIKWAERNADRIRLGRAFALDAAASTVGGEQAAYSLEDAAARLYETENLSEWWDEYVWLLDEAERRGIAL